MVYLPKDAISIFLSLNLFVIPSIPLSKSPQAFSQTGIGLEAEVLFEGRRVSVSNRHITWLHRYKFLVGLEVIIFRKNSCTHQLFLQDGHEVKEVFGRVVTDVIYLVRGNGQSVLAVLLLGGVLHDAHHSLHDVVDIGEVALAVAIIENLDGIAFHQLVGEAKVSHIRTTCRTIDSKEAKACRRNIIELAISMGHKFVTLLGGCIKRYRIINLVIS